MTITITINNVPISSIIITTIITSHATTLSRFLGWVCEANVGMPTQWELTCTRSDGARYRCRYVRQQTYISFEGG